MGSINPVNPVTINSVEQIHASEAAEVAPARLLPGRARINFRENPPHRSANLGGPEKEPSDRMPDLLQKMLAERPWLLADGATGTNLFAVGLPTGHAPELWNIDEPDKVRDQYRAFIKAGSDIILTNTFGGTRNRLKLHRAAERVAELSMAGARLAREVVELSGREILVGGEQGVGDEILFTSMVPDLLEAGAEVMLECDERLVDLYARSFPAVRCVPRLDPPADEALDAAIDFQAPSGSLGLWLRAEEAAFPGRPSFLVADAEAAAGFRSRYAEDGGDLLVGLSWFSLRPGKSIDLDIMEPLFEVPGVRFIDLQYGDTAQERARFERRTGHRLIHDASVDPMADLDGFAAQVASLDLVISISNTTVHMAGALGVPVWLMLSTHLIWRWGVESSDSLWYPAARLFRQAQTGDWPGLVERVRRELAARAAG